MRYHLWFAPTSRQEPHEVQDFRALSGAPVRAYTPFPVSAQPLRTVLRALPLPFSHRPKVLCADHNALLLFILAFTRALYKFF